MQSRGLRCQQERAGAVVHVERRGLCLGVHRLGEAGGRLTRGRGEADLEGRRSGRAGLFDEQREDRRHGGGLAGPRTSRDHREAAQDGRCCREALVVGILAREQPGQARSQQLQVHALHGRVAPNVQVGGDLALVAPVAVQIEAGADEPQRAVAAGRAPGCHKRARSQLADPAVMVGPRQALRIGRLVSVNHDRLFDGGEVDANAAQPGGPDRERRSQQDPLVPIAEKRPQPSRHVNVGRGQHACVVEDTQEARRVPHVQRVIGIHPGSGTAGTHGRPRSSRSLSASTRAPGGLQENTPQRWPPTLDVAAPVIPRRKRYRTPARLRSTE